MSMAAIGALTLNEAKEDLNEYLTTLDYDVLLNIEAVMFFFGKFVNQDIDDKYKMCVELGQSKEDIVDLILGLTPACESYFEYAIQQAKGKGIDLDDFQLPSPNRTSSTWVACPSWPLAARRRRPEHAFNGCILGNR